MKNSTLHIVSDKELTDNLVFIPTWDNEPPTLPPIIELQGTSILTYQNISVLIAQPGLGKSSVCEAILSKIINKDADSLGIDVTATKCLYIDCERTNADVHASWRRMMRRAKVKTAEEVIYAGISRIGKRDERKSTIEKLIQDNEGIDLLVIDGAGDLVEDPNSLIESIELKAWIRTITSKYGLSILTTLHSNKGTDTPRGHIGSELLREAECILTIKREGEIRKITTDFEHGKNRNGGHVETYFKYCDYAGGMISATIEEFNASSSPNYQKRHMDPPITYFDDREKIHTALSHIVGKEALGYKDLLAKVKKHIFEHHGGCMSGDNVCKAWITSLVEGKYLIKNKGIKHAVYLFRSELPDPPQLFQSV